MGEHTPADDRLDTSTMSEAELADYYNRTDDLSEFEGGEVVELTPGRRDVVISVRFSAEEIGELRERADAAGMKVTAFIRAAALQSGRPVDVSELTALLGNVRDELERASLLVG